MAKKEYGHLVKPMLVRSAPDGLYDEPRVWMEAKDLEGSTRISRSVSSRSRLYSIRSRGPWCTPMMRSWSSEGLPTTT